MFTERAELRQIFWDAWNKRDFPHLLSALEQQLLSIIKAHHEYIFIFEDLDSLNEDYETDQNPFLHMSLHLSVIEQVTTNRPLGIRNVYQKAYRRMGNEHDVQHLFMEIMADIIYESQQQHKLPDENLYLERLFLKIT